ncbi:SRPBCC family protein [Streptomyces sp. NPDC092296]|uniref:SRPBCC family protein n=1 Tax=Streptomyces sp. NPDC092296 TaxID=3366012 RepID=UPI0037F3EAE9
MAVRHGLVRRTPQTVWSVLADGSQYAKWVVGTAETREADSHWPEVGSEIHYCVRLGPARLRNRTVVRVCEPPHRLELEAVAGPLGTARIAIQLMPWGNAETLVIVDEHPLRGPGSHLHMAPVEILIQLRHRRMLTRLAKVVEAAP